MAAATSKVSCPAGAWTEVATGSANVIVQLFSADGSVPIAYRLALGSAAPSDGTSGIVAATSSQGLEFGGLGDTDNVYVWPLSVVGLAQVLTW